MTVSASAADVMALRRMIHSVIIGIFGGGNGMDAFVGVWLFK